MTKRSPAMSRDVYHWPEFVALARRLGVAHDRPTARLVISLDMRDAVEIDHEYLGADQQEEETT